MDYDTEELELDAAAAAGDRFSRRFNMHGIGGGSRYGRTGRPPHPRTKTIGAGRGCAKHSASDTRRVSI